MTGPGEIEELRLFQQLRLRTGSLTKRLEGSQRGTGMEPDDLPCSRNAHDQNVHRPMRAIQGALRFPFLKGCGKEEGNGKSRGVGVTVLSPRPPELRTANYELLIALFSPVSRFACDQDAGGLFEHPVMPAQPALRPILEVPSRWSLHQRPIPPHLPQDRS